MTHRQVQASSGHCRSGTGWHKPQWHAWHHPRSCWQGSLPERSEHQSQAMMPSCPSGLLCRSRSVKWQECKLLLVTGNRQSSTQNPVGSLRAASEGSVALAVLVRVRAQTIHSRPSSIMDVWHVVSNDRPKPRRSSSPCHTSFKVLDTPFIFAFQCFLFSPFPNEIGIRRQQRERLMKADLQETEQEELGKAGVLAKVRLRPHGEL